MANSAAEKLGRKGGKSTAAKRTKEQRSEAAKTAATKRWAAARADTTPNAFIFELALDGDWFVQVNNKRERGYYYSDHRAQVLVDNGFITLSREELQPHGSVHRYYSPTEAGMRWWYEERLRIYQRNAEEYEHLRIGALAYKFSPSSLTESVEGKGIGSVMQFHAVPNGPAVFTALRDGLFDFVAHGDYSGMPHSHNEYFTVALTLAGFAYFGSLPRLIEVWE